MENNTNGGFSYTYSAKEQEELKRIREKYAPKEEDGMARLRRLDREVTKKAETVALIIGIIGVLVMGFGMSLVMSPLAGSLGIGETVALIVGISLGLIGAALAALAYPLYNLVLKREREKIAPEIIRITDGMLK
ncbi:MAG: hypothetical protein IJY18_05250 [Clostridia bacterium]|nr:hypothetical protein [Clostridia bacterium]